MSSANRSARWTRRKKREEEEEEEEEAFGDPSVHPSVIIGTRTVIHST